MSEVTTTPEYEAIPDTKRQYRVKVDKKHRPAQIHRDIVVVTDADEVHDSNASQFDMRYVRTEFSEAMYEIFPEAFTDNTTFNEQLAVIMEYAKKHKGEIRLLTATPSPAPTEVQVRHVPKEELPA